jgi:hypothetical protein
MKRFALAICALLAAASTASAAGHVRNANFLVFVERGPDAEATDEFAESVLISAQRYREAIAREWLGRKLPHGVGRTTISVTFSAVKDSGLTWAIDDPSRRYHTVYLETSADRAIGSTLAHEMVHVVLATHFPYPNRLPAWLEEGIASRYDDAEKKEIRRASLQYMVERDGYAQLNKVMGLANIVADDVVSYAAAASLVEMLLERGDRSRLLEFGAIANRAGVPTALQQCYSISDTKHLQSTWQEWLAAKHRGSLNQRLSRLDDRSVYQR